MADGPPGDGDASAQTAANVDTATAIISAQEGSTDAQHPNQSTDTADNSGAIPTEPSTETQPSETQKSTNDPRTDGDAGVPAAAAADVTASGADTVVVTSANVTLLEPIGGQDGDTPTAADAATSTSDAPLLPIDPSGNTAGLLSVVVRDGESVSDGASEAAIEIGHPADAPRSPAPEAETGAVDVTAASDGRTQSRADDGNDKNESENNNNNDHDDDIESGNDASSHFDHFQPNDVAPLTRGSAVPDTTSTTSTSPSPTTNTTPHIKSNLTTWFNKKYIGGYKHRHTNIEYFHAETQTLTPQERRAREAGERFHRDTQTKIWHNRRHQTTQNTSTQMTRTGCYVTVETDLVLTPRVYITADEFHELQVQKAITIQCFVRKTYARRRVQAMRRERDRRVKAMSEKDRRRITLMEKKRLKDIENRLHPKTCKDFEVLYNGLENWRVQETDRINRMGYTEPARLAALADLLDQESALLQKIDRLKIAANEENREKATIRLLESMASPKRWPATTKDNAVVLVDTPSTIRARELRDLYHALNLPLLSVDERLQILLHVKYTVKEFDCNLSREIVELIDREGDLVSRGRNASSLEGLRRRISNLFLQFIRTPEFNPEARTHQAFPHAGQAWKRDAAVYYCRGCTKYKPSTEFYLSTTMKHLGKCKDCTMKENLATERADDAAYGDMLKLVRVQEAMKRKTSGAPVDAAYNAMALLQESDMRYLVDVIWNRKSAIGGSRSMEELILTRWNPHLELSPWNCILLTKAEAATHDRRPNPAELYSSEFVNKVLQRHLLAKQHFGQLPVMAKYLKHHYTEDRDGKLVPRVESDKLVAP